MSEHIYKMIELVGSSHTSIEGAIQNAIAKAALDEKRFRQEGSSIPNQSA